jgi:hypothetical protein
MKAIVACAFLAIAVLPAQAASWHEVGRQGVMHFVVIDPAMRDNQDVYRGAIVELCKDAVICQVHFWISDKIAPRALPMNDVQAGSQLAIWEYNGNNGYRSLRWRCDIVQEPDCL